LFPCEFVACTTIVAAEFDVGVPDIRPELFNDNPEGRVPLTKDHVIGVDPLACS
jgi:hypothetical protein